MFRVLTPLLALAVLASMNANAATPKTGKLLTCRKMEQNCLAFARRADMAAGPEGVTPYNVSASSCYDAYERASEAGVWPANPPFGFALACIKE